jgi:hypothetical protein
MICIDLSQGDFIVIENVYVLLGRSNEGSRRVR